MPEEKSKLEKEAEKPKESKPRIDPSVPWDEEHNLEAAKELGVSWNGRGYDDEEGCPTLDEYGQPF
jgi:hypothetical protein